MARLFRSVQSWLRARCCDAVSRLSQLPGLGRTAREQGQTTAEYALVILAAAAVALVLIAWARSSGKLPAFFDTIIDEITDSAE